MKGAGAQPITADRILEHLRSGALILDCPSLFLTSFRLFLIENRARRFDGISAAIQEFLKTGAFARADSR